VRRIPKVQVFTNLYFSSNYCWIALFMANAMHFK